jgi:N,N'-diacetyllegionaminate synthase
MIIAEAGVNHNGDLTLAKKLIEVAAKAGADFVKFQTFKADKLVQKNAEKAKYQKLNENDNGSQFEMLKKLELTVDDHFELIDHCQECGIKFLSTAFDLESIEFLKDKLDFYKIPSGEITNLPYLEKVAKLGLPIVMSSGMATLDEVKDALAVLTTNGILLENIIVLHCNTEYPTPMHDVNLKAMINIATKLKVKVGYSDHTLGIEVPIAAVSLGACVLEKHFTLDRNLEGPDHAASLEPEELIAMVSAIRNIELALGGSGTKEPSPSEQKNIKVARKSIVAVKDIKKGEVFSIDNITVKRPGTGITPMKWYEVLGRKSIKDFKADEMIEL